MVTMVQMTTRPVPLGEYVPSADQRIVLHGIDWSGFETLLALRGERSSPRMTYLDGVLEIMSPSRDHEGIKTKIGSLLETYCLERDIAFAGYGSWLLKQKPKKSGIEPDECYVFAEDPLTKDRPDLAIEVIWTSGGIDKLEVYKRLGVDEVWLWQRDTITVYGLGPKGYARRSRSAWLPELDLKLICRAVHHRTINAAVAELRASMKK
jgi:Uma2 family endonuclease